MPRFYRGEVTGSPAYRQAGRNMKPVYNYAYFLDEAGAIKEASDYYHRAPKLSWGKGDLAEKALARLKGVREAQGEAALRPRPRTTFLSPNGEREVKGPVAGDAPLTINPNHVKTGPWWPPRRACLPADVSRYTLHLPIPTRKGV